VLYVIKKAENFHDAIPLFFFIFFMLNTRV
jgi:hypothetical protein